MIESSENKKRIFYIVVLILTLIATLISTTLAYYSFVRSQKDESTKLYTGKLEIDYIDGVYIKNPELWPKKSVDFNATANVYRNNFAVTSSGTLDQTISIDLVVTNNEFREGSLRYNLYSDKGIELSTGNVPKDGSINLINNLFLAHDGTSKYVLIIWLRETKNNQNSDMGKTVTGKINIYSKQLKY